MQAIDIPAIERRARQLRAEEIQRLQGLFGERARLYATLLGTSLLHLAEAISQALRPLFSWNPQDAAERAGRPSPAVRANRIARALFAWNPQKRHPC